ncbi:MAG: phosphoglycerate dehydrogenase [Fuerstiella sp.]
MLKVLCTSLGAEEGPHFQLLRNAGFQCDVVSRDVNLRDNDELSRALQGYHAVVAGAEPYSAKVLQGATNLRVISRTGVGFDAIDLAACDELGIVVATTPGVNHHAVAEQTIALLMGIARGFPGYDRMVRSCRWSRKARPRVMGSTLGLIGLGRIGQATATRGVGLGMKVIAADPFAPAEFAQEHGIELVSLDELYARSDYISLHTPVTDQTRGMINAQTIAKMKESAVLINTARGQLVNEADLCQALESGRLRAAGLDVFEVEPLPASSPLLQMENVFLSPHVAGLDCESHEDTFAMAADTVIQLHAGHWPQERIQNLQGKKKGSGFFFNHTSEPS